jgi:hypothetical protein
MVAQIDAVGVTNAVFAVLVAVVAGLTALTVAGLGLVVAYQRLRAQLQEIHRQAKLRDEATDRDVETLAAANMRRGRLEATTTKDETGVPLMTEREVIREDVVRAYQPIMPALKQLRDDNPNASPAKFGLLLEQFKLDADPENTLGKWLVKHICEPYKLKDFACWDIAYRLVHPDVMGDL